jgi:hypothetical protein
MQNRTGKVRHNTATSLPHISLDLIGANMATNSRQLPNKNGASFRAGFVAGAAVTATCLAGSTVFPTAPLQNENVFPPMMAASILPPPVVGLTDRDEETQNLFEQFAREWTSDTENLSDAQSILLHPSYHKILAMGASVLPLIFDDMASGDGARWLPALDAITLGRVNPIKPEHEEDAILMCQDWLEWATAHELVSD